VTKKAPRVAKKAALPALKAPPSALQASSLALHSTRGNQKSGTRDAFFASDCAKSVALGT